MIQRIKNIYHLAWAMLAVIKNAFPARKLVVIGVTGTDGKTTTANYIYSVLRAAGKKVALISTISAVIDGEEYQTGFHVTTPGSSKIQSYLKKAKERGVKYVVLEVTSHALDQNRVYGIPFTVGVITNISHEHLDYHKTMERYTAAKMKLLKRAKVAIINKDDESFKDTSKIMYSWPKKKVVTYGLKKDSDVNPKVFAFTTKLPGIFNQYNALAAIAVGRVLGLSESTIRKGIATTVPPKGREEIVYKKDFTVMVDFAHTPHALKNILQTIKDEMQGRGKIIHVFGSAGERDKSKRPAMGKTSGKFADIIILTSEDPRKEKVEVINKAIKSGIGRKRDVYEISSRKEAIEKALFLARKNDYVLISGKGHEESMNFGHGEEKWSDRDAVKDALEKL